MPRHELTDTEQEKLEATQEAVQQARTQLVQARARAEDVYELICDRHGVEANGQAQYEDGALVVPEDGEAEAD